VSVGGVSAFASFEIFECGDAFDILLGKPWLHSVRALHNYETDEIRIRSSGREVVLYNEPRVIKARRPGAAVPPAREMGIGRARDVGHAAHEPAESAGTTARTAHTEVERAVDVGHAALASAESTGTTASTAHTKVERAVDVGHVPHASAESAGTTVHMAHTEVECATDMGHAAHASAESAGTTERTNEDEGDTAITHEESVEERWHRSELLRLARKRGKERARKEMQLE
jgi:hypothetical protein